MGEREIEMDGMNPNGTDDADVHFKPNQTEEEEDPEFDDPEAPKKPPGFDYNVYATQKTIAKGLLDVALLSHNAVQLKGIIEFGEDHKFYTLLMTLLILSIILQIAVGIMLLVLGQMKITTKSVQKKASIVNNATTGVVFGVVVVNIIIAAFTSQTVQTSAPPSKEP